MPVHSCFLIFTNHLPKFLSTDYTDIFGDCYDNSEDEIFGDDYDASGVLGDDEIFGDDYTEAAWSRTSHPSAQPGRYTEAKNKFASIFGRR